MRVLTIAGMVGMDRKNLGDEETIEEISRWWQHTMFGVTTPCVDRAKA